MIWTHGPMTVVSKYCQQVNTEKCTSHDQQIFDDWLFGVDQKEEKEICFVTPKSEALQELF